MAQLPQQPPQNQPGTQNQSLDYWIHNPLNPYRGLGGLQNDLNQQAWAGYQSIFGRAPTNDELAQASQAFSSGDPHTSNMQQGMAYVAQAHQATENTPDKLAATQQAKYLEEAPKHFDSVNQLFQGQLGRAATQDELNHFGSALSSGTVDQYQLQQFLQQQPEYVNKQNEQFRTGLEGKLADSDKAQFSSKILPSIQEAYAKQGRSFDSSSFQAAATNSAQQQNTERDKYIANLSAQQYGGVQDRAYQDYAAQVAQQQNLTNSGIQAQYSGIQNTTNRSNQIGDFNTQSQLYNQYLAKYGKRNNGLGGLLGTVGGAALGGFLGKSVESTQLGASLGGTVGQGGQNFAGGSY